MGAILTQSILPVLTKVKVNDPEFDITIMQYTMAEQLKKEITNQITKAKGSFFENNQMVDEFLSQEWQNLLNDYEN